MKKLVILMVLLLMVQAGFSQKHHRIIQDPKNQKPMLVGKCKLSDLQKGDFKEWFDKEYADYKADTKTLDLLKGQWRDISIMVVMGTWCSDSRREVPRFSKILDYAGFKKKNLRMVCVDRDKKAGDLDISVLKIQYVPTIIIYRKGSEMGRIIESPAETLEKDLYKFVGLTDRVSGKTGK